MNRYYHVCIEKRELNNTRLSSFVFYVRYTPPATANVRKSPCSAALLVVRSSRSRRSPVEGNDTAHGSASGVSPGGKRRDVFSYKRWVALYMRKGGKGRSAIGGRARLTAPLAHLRSESSKPKKSRLLYDDPKGVSTAIYVAPQQSSRPEKLRNGGAQVEDKKDALSLSFTRKTRLCWWGWCSRKRGTHVVAQDRGRDNGHITIDLR